MTTATKLSWFAVVCFAMFILLFWVCAWFCSIYSWAILPSCATCISLFLLACFAALASNDCEKKDKR